MIYKHTDLIRVLFTAFCKPLTWQAEEMYINMRWHDQVCDKMWLCSWWGATPTVILVSCIMRQRRNIMHNHLLYHVSDHLPNMCQQVLGRLAQWREAHFGCALPSGSPYSPDFCTEVQTILTAIQKSVLCGLPYGSPHTTDSRV